MPADEYAWPGYFTSDRLHRVLAANRQRLSARGHRFGLAECGAACVPASPTRGPRTRCRACWPSAEDDTDVLPLPVRVPRTSPTPTRQQMPSENSERTRLAERVLRGLRQWPQK